MIILDGVKIPNNFTGCVFIGGGDVNFFEPPCDTFNMEKIGRNSKKIYSLGRHEAIDLAYSLGCSLSSWHYLCQKSQTAHDAVILFYISGKFELKIELDCSDVIGRTYYNFSNTAVFLSAILRTLLKLRNQENFKIEYICRYPEYPAEKCEFFSSKVIKCLVGFGHRNSACISYQTSQDERVYVCIGSVISDKWYEECRACHLTLEDMVYLEDWQLDIRAYRGKGIRTDDGILVYWKKDDQIKGVVLSGNDWKRKLPKSMPCLSEDDLQRINEYTNYQQLAFPWCDWR